MPRLEASGMFALRCLLVSAALEFTLLVPFALASEPPFITAWGSYGAADGQLQDAVNLSASPNGSIYVADWGNYRVEQFTSLGGFVRKWDVAGPAGIAAAKSGNVYVCTDYAIQEYSPEGTSIRTWGSQGSGPGQFLHVLDVAVDDEGGVYAADYVNHRIQRFDSTGVFLNQWGLQGTGSGFPKGVTVGHDGYVYVADAGNSTIQKYTKTGVFMTAWSLPYGIPGEGNRLGRPAITQDGLVCVPDKFGSQIAVFTTSGAYVETWGSPGTGAGQFNTPTCAAVDHGGSLYVMDFWNHRIQKFGSPITGFPESSGTPPRLIAVTPNPTSGTIQVRLMAARTPITAILISDARGRLVRRLWMGGAAPPTLSWDGRDEAGAQVASGVYFVRLRGERISSKSFVVLR
jgi:flagellar hook capping protein FlgD/NHL repeat-containing protein